MTIGIDASRANRENKTGTEWYSYHVIEELKKIIPDEHRVILYANNKLNDGLGNIPANWQEKNLGWPPKYLWTQVRLWWELLINPPDVLFVPAHTIPFLPIRRRIKVVVTVHDVGFKRFPELYRKIQVWYHDLTMRKIRKRADTIITDSQFSQREIAGLYLVDPEKIKVVYLGYDRKYQKPHEATNQKDEASDFGENNVLEKYGISRPYLLYVGRLEKKKNINNIIRAYVQVKSQYPEIKMVLAGSGGDIYQETKKIIAEEKVGHEIILTGYVAEADLPVLFGAAEVFIFPTLYEGFGLPLIQAMACGTPVVTSDLPLHREVTGGAAALAYPLNHRQIAQEIIQVLSNEIVRQELIDKGLARARNFSWQRTAEGILETLNSKF